MLARSRGSPRWIIHNPSAILAAFSVLALVQIGVVLSGNWLVLGPDGLLAGPDSYMRLLRVEIWMQAGGWRDTGFPLSNAPYGENLHWTRPFDVLLWLGSRPLGLVMGLREGLFLWGVAISPVLQGLTVVALSWATRPILSSRAFVFLVLLFSIQPAVRAVFGVARPDHHALLALLFAVGFALVLRGFAGPGRSRLFGAAGAVAGLAIWVSIEGAAPALVATGVLGCLWLRHGGWYLHGLGWYLAGSIVALSLALPLERPTSELLAVEFDRLSIVHWSLLASALGAVAVVAGLCAIAKRRVEAWRVGGWNWRARLAGAAFIGATPLALALTLFPRFFGGPFADVDPLLNTIWLKHIDEVRPMSGADMAFFLGPVAMGAAYLCWSSWSRLWGCRQDMARIEWARAEWDAVIYTLALLVMFTPLAVYQVRWSIYPSIVAMAPWVLFLRAAFGYDGAWRIRGGAGDSMRIPLRVPFFLAVLSAPVAAGAAGLALTVGFPNSTSDESAACPWLRIAPVLRELKTANGEPPILFGFIHQGPEMMYRTGLRVVGTPYHRNAQGILDTHAVLTATDPEDARRILRARGVGYLIFCRDSGESRFFRAMKADTFYRRIYERRAPKWLHEQKLPLIIKDQFQLLRVEKIK
jgi:hypothetical protein